MKGMSEDEAKTTWCPFVRAGNSRGNQGGSLRGFNEWSCIAHRCAAWRVVSEATHFPTGYCGLAGKP